ncbi:hypothetical protein Scep_002329 [Stephania cephalantha]|uniref:Uncharacterized protein n=1 Tax=Stephania cephalantha TaxID=152367 RepID=A0AAP0Q4V6_9MAGN
MRHQNRGESPLWLLLFGRLAVERVGVRPPWPNPMAKVVMAGVSPLPSVPSGLGWRATPTHHRREKKKVLLPIEPVDREEEDGAHGPSLDLFWSRAGSGPDPFASTRPKQKKKKKEKEKKRIKKMKGKCGKNSGKIGKNYILIK